ncbi:NAD(P)/FAD-dependent oxidoreductase [Nocardioides sp. J54]|uniref:NAD(P)/FAD-dependent oxidoreductase n=1 Tax=Nocardioides sp. J54 TaxID=935866 RepID=UPI0009FE9968|nr:FAD-dependent oxidoreductase [Nocardioides sp. J54]
MSRHVVIVGAGVAGLRAAEATRRHHPDVRVTLVGEEPWAPYQRPPLSKELLTRVDDPAEPVPLNQALDADDPLVVRRLGVRATALDPAARTVTLDDGSSLSWDRLVIATGVRAAVPAAWRDVPGVLTLRTFADLGALRDAFTRARSAVIVGAGVLGCEVAAAARQRGLSVDLVDAADQPMLRMLGPEVGRFVAGLHHEQGTLLHLGRHVADLADFDGGPVVTLDDGVALRPDAVVVAVGAAPDLGWLDGAGLELDGGVVVSATQATSLPDVFAVGDVAVLRDGADDGRPMRHEHWTYAGDSAATAATNLFLDPADHVATTALPYAWSDQWGCKVQTLGRVSGPPTLVRGSFEDRRFLALFAEDGVVVGAAACNHVPHLMKARSVIEQGRTLPDAVEHLGDRTAAPTPTTTLQETRPS